MVLVETSAPAPAMNRVRGNRGLLQLTAGPARPRCEAAPARAVWALKFRVEIWLLPCDR